MRIPVTLLLFALAAPALGASPPMGGGYGAIDAARDTDPVSLARAFCTASIAGDEAALAPWFAPKLVDSLAELHAAHPAAAIPWRSFADRPTGCATAVLNGYANTIGVLVRVDFTAAARHWSDTLNFERTETSWRLNNVFYEAGGNLRFRIVDLAGP